MAVDPLTGNLWQTENGMQVYDEINLVENRFNSGWSAITGPSDRVDAITDPVLFEKGIQSLEGFVYSDPEFSWYDSVTPTALEFPNFGFGK